MLLPTAAGRLVTGDLRQRLLAVSDHETGHRTGDRLATFFSQRFLRPREEPEVGYVVNAVSASGLKMWISPPKEKARRVFGPRRDAEIFRTQKEAQDVIASLEDKFRQVGFNFEVESAS